MERCCAAGIVLALALLPFYSGTLSADDAGAAAPATSDAALDQTRYARTVRGEFQDVFDDLKFAISEHNYRITGVNSIGQAIAERDDQPYTLSSVVHFCNIQAAREIIEISTDFLLHMPCRVVLQEIGNGEILIEARLLPRDPRLHEIADRVNLMLRQIVDFAAGDW